MTNYAGTLDVSGSLVGELDSSAVDASFSGTLGVTLSTSLNGSDTGSASETVDGDITVTYTNGGSGAQSFVLDFSVPNIAINSGSFDDSVDNIPVTFLGMTFGVILTGSVGQSSASENLTAVSSGTSGPLDYDVSSSASGTLPAEVAGPDITGTLGDQTTTDQAAVTPFAAVAISDTNSGATETVTVTLSAPANGTLSNLDGGSYDASSGVYTVTGSTAAVTTALDGLVFNPTVGQAPGQTVSTTFTINATDQLSETATDSTTSVTTTDISVVLSAASTQYQVADDSGSLYLVNTGTGGTQTLPGVTVIEFTDGTGIFDPTGTAEDIARLYGAALDRAPDLTGLEYWTAQVDDSNVPLASVANYFADSPEFVSDYGSLNNTQFVEQLYQNVLGRTADSAGLAYWTTDLADGATRGSVLVGFAESQEYEADTQSLTTSNTMFAAGDQDNGEIYRLYEATLDRAPDPTGQAYWVSQLQGGESMTQIAASFLASSEFQSDYGSLTPTQFVTQLYSNVLDRAPDSAGLNYWVGQINQGASEASVVLGFSDSAEFRADTAAATHANLVFIPTST